jgi:hypothetical protein
MDIRRRMSTLSALKGSPLIPLFLFGPSCSRHFRTQGEGLPKIQGRSEGRPLQRQEGWLPDRVGTGARPALHLGLNRGRRGGSATHTTLISKAAP